MDHSAEATHNFINTDPAMRLLERASDPIAQRLLTMIWARMSYDMVDKGRRPLGEFDLGYMFSILSDELTADRVRSVVANPLRPPIDEPGIF